MTLNEAIKHCMEKSNDTEICQECRLEHSQLAYWLTELKEYKKEYSIVLETFNYGDISKVYDKLSGYKFKTLDFIVDSECQKVILEIQELTKEECDELVKEFEDELWYEVHKGDTLLFEKNNEF